MKLYHKIGLVFLCCIFLGLVGFGSYKIYMFTYGEKDKYKYENSDISLEAVNKKDETNITQNTKLTIENYNRKENSIVELEETMPVEYIGKNREQLEEILTKYIEDPSIEDLELGFENYQIMSFSNKKVVLRKTFMPPNVAYKYYLTFKDGCVIVYYIDKKTVFEYTSICVDALPVELQKQLYRGKYITDLDSLYDFLENYSS